MSKPVFLAAVSTSRRFNDLRALRIGEGSSEGLHQQDRPRHIRRKILVHPLRKITKKMDPERAVQM